MAASSADRNRIAPRIGTALGGGGMGGGGMGAYDGGMGSGASNTRAVQKEAKKKDMGKAGPQSAVSGKLRPAAKEEATSTSWAEMRSDAEEDERARLFNKARRHRSKSGTKCYFSPPRRDVADSVSESSGGDGGSGYDGSSDGSSDDDDEGPSGSLSADELVNQVAAIATVMSTSQRDDMIGRLRALQEQRRTSARSTKPSSSRIGSENVAALQACAVASAPFIRFRNVGVLEQMLGLPAGLVRDTLANMTLPKIPGFADVWIIFAALLFVRVVSCMPAEARATLSSMANQVDQFCAGLGLQDTPLVDVANRLAARSIFVEK